MNILISDNLAQTGIEILKATEGFQVEVATELTNAELLSIIGEYDALVIRGATKVTRDVIEAAQRLKVIGRAGIGLDNVDIDAATERGVAVMNTPEGNTITTAEHTLSLLLAVSRHIAQATASLKALKWEKKKFRGTEIQNKILGIIGVGRIGRIVADKALAMKMRVVGYDLFIAEATIRKLGLEPVSMDELLGMSDYITVHTTLTSKTRNLINRDSFAKMKDGVIVINCARGGIINEADLAAALESGKVAAAALDVYEQEPPPKDHPLLKFDNMICTPHLGASTSEAQENVAVAVAEQILGYLLRGEVKNAVNLPSIAGEEATKIRPYRNLAEKLGALLGHLAPERPERMIITLKGEMSKFSPRPITQSAMTAFLSVGNPEVNMVNSLVVAESMGLGFTENQESACQDFTNAITIAIEGAGGPRRVVMGTVFGKREPRLVMLDSFRLDSYLEGNMVLIYNHDLPGTFGRIGTCLGKNGCHITMWKAGQVPEFKQNILLIQVEEELTDRLISDLEEIENVISVTRLVL